MKSYFAPFPLDNAKNSAPLNSFPQDGKIRGSEIMKIIHGERSMRVIDFPLWIGIFAFPLAAFMCVEFVLHVLHGAPIKQSSAILLGAFVAGFGGAMLTQRSEFLFDSVERKVIWSRRSVFGSRRGVISFADIEFAVVQCTSLGGGRPGPAPSYRVALVTKDEPIPLTASYAGGKINDDRCRKLRASINKMLDVRLASEDDNDIIQLARNGQRVWAVAMATTRYQLNTTKAHELVDRLISEADHQTEVV